MKASNPRDRYALTDLGTDLNSLENKMPRINELTLLPKLPLLITESADEFDALRDAFEGEIKPRGIVEQMYVHDICSIVWEILRLRRCKVAIINSAFRSSLPNLLKQAVRQSGQYEYDVEDEAKALAQAWFTDQEAKKQVSEILARFDLEESAIEAEAIRRSSSELDLLDRARAPVPVQAQARKGQAAMPTATG